MTLTLSLPLSFLSPTNPSLPKPTGTTHQRCHHQQRHPQQRHPRPAPHSPSSSCLSHEIHQDLKAEQRLRFLMVALILLVAVPISPPLDLLGFWIFRVEFLFVDFLFRFLIWFCGCFCLFDMDFWAVGGCFLDG